MLGVFSDYRIERVYFTYRTLEERPREAFLFRIGPLQAQESRDHVLGRVFSQFPLEKHLYGELTRFSSRSHSRELPPTYPQPSAAASRGKRGFLPSCRPECSKVRTKWLRGTAPPPASFPCRDSRLPWKTSPPAGRWS